MTFAAIVAAAAGAVLLSETMGRGQVVYTRMASLAAAYLLCGVGGGYVAAGGAHDWMTLAAVLLSGVPLMAAWLGLRIHLSNSITLELADLLAGRRSCTVSEITDAYDVDGHMARRVTILQAGGYLSTDHDARVVDCLKTHVVLALIRAVCGPDGPRSVAARLRRGSAAA